MNKKFFILALVLLSAAAVCAQSSVFTAPKWADTVSNPLKGNAAALAAGKKIYASFCVVCHGDKGKGDGVGASGLSKRPADHTSRQVQAQTDGALYWMITSGNNPMPSYKTTLTETQRWEVVDFIRSLAHKPKK